MYSLINRPIIWLSEFLFCQISKSALKKIYFSRAWGFNRQWDAVITHSSQSLKKINVLYTAVSLVLSVYTNCSSIFVQMSVTWIVQRRWLGCDPLAGLLHFMLCVSIKLYGLRLKQSCELVFKKHNVQFSGMTNQHCYICATVGLSLNWLSYAWTALFVFFFTRRAI